MIKVFSNAGLANRMFQYAFYKAIEHKGIDVYFDEKSYKAEWAFEDVLLTDIFPNLQYKENGHFGRVAKADIIKS
jgi:hypothetical protein